MKHEEFQIQKMIAQYLRLKHPTVLFRSDTVASVKLTMGQAVRNKAIQCPGFHAPDLHIVEARNGYHGLFIELKTESPFKKNGELKSNEHLENQWQTILTLRNRGYKADFAVGYDQAIEQIEAYLNHF